MKAKNKVTQIMLIILFIVLAVITLFPIYFMAIASFKDTGSLFKDGLGMVFQFDNLIVDNYIYTLTTKSGVYLHWYWNSIIVMIASTVLSLLFSSMGGYALAAYRFRGQRILFVLMMIVMMIPLEILLIPLYRMIINMHLINTKAGAILPFLVQPTAMFFFQQFVAGLDKDYMDAGRMDGCTEFGIFFRIMTPLMRPAFGAMTILLALRNWNAFLWPLIVFTTDESYTLPVGLASLISSYGNNYEMLIPGAVLALVPLVVIFLLNQNQFVEGLSAGGVKG
jgi:arabinosaccharide transport system permease protein